MKVPFFPFSFDILISFEKKLEQSWYRPDISLTDCSRRFHKIDIKPSEMSSNNGFNLDFYVACNIIYSHILFCFFFTFKSTLSYKIIYFILSTYVSLCEFASLFRNLLLYSLLLLKFMIYRLLDRYCIIVCQIWQFCRK